MKQEKEHWFVAEIYTKKPSIAYRIKLFKFMLGIVTDIENINWHFFHEDWDKSKMSKEMLKEYGHLFPKETKGYMFLFRVRVKTKDDIKEVKKIFDKYKNKIKGIYKKIIFPAYYGEQKYYSEKGWEYVQNYFYECSCIAMLIIPVFKGKWLNTSKLVHTFLNQLGYGTKGEFNFHLHRAISIYNHCKLKNDVKKEVKKAMEELNKLK